MRDREPNGQGAATGAPAAAAPHATLTRATVMFADIVGFSALSERLGPERAYFAVTGALRMLDGIARRHGGAVDKYLGDCVMVVFGHPVPLADPAAAAAAAALEMREQVQAYSREIALPLDLIVGINTGPMVAGDVRGAVVREFHVLGDAVNVAARLKARAPHGGIYVGPDTQRETCEAFEYESLGRMPLKGKTVEVPIFALVGARRARVASGAGAPQAGGVAFIGRTGELGLLREHLARLGTGTGGVVLVTGQDGMGKSRLVAHAETLPEASPAVFVRAGGGPGSRGDAAELVTGLLDTLGTAVAPATTAEAPDGLFERLVTALRGRSAERPVVVVLEDVDRMDAGARDLVPRIAARMAGEPVSLLLTLRPEPPDILGDLRRGLEAFGVTEIALGPLSASEAARLVEAAGGAAVTEESLALILAHGAGNPARIIHGTFLEPALRAERERGQEDRRSGETERRRATILFADITGFTALTERHGAERAYPVVVGCLRLLDDIARAHGGTVEKYLGDCVMALFGVPEAIEDAPRAAVNAAIEMRRRVRAYSERLGPDMRLDVHSGIHTGVGIAGDISGPLIREFAVMGDPVSVADELKDLAPAGQVYVGVDVYRATREVFAYEELEPSTRKGHDTPLRMFALRSEQEHLHRARLGAERRVFSSLVGRDRELALLREAVGRVRAGAGGVVSVVAPAGLGKSRLVTDLARGDDARGLTWCEGRSVSAGRHRAFHAIIDLCRSLVGIAEADDDARAAETLARAIRRLLPDERDEVLPFVATLLGLPLDDDQRARLAGLRGDAMEKLTLRAVTQLLRGAAGAQPVVAVMDDLHWADISSIELLEALLRLCEERPILFLCLFRPGFPTTSERIREQARRHHGDRHVEVELAPLDAAAARSMLNNLFRPGDLPRPTRQVIEEKAGGNPFYIEEVIRALVDEGAVELVEGRFRATDRIASVVIPGSIHELVMARVDGLAPAKRQVLQTASVIGGSFQVPVLAAVIEQAPGLADTIDDLVHAEFLVASERLPGQEYAFKHPLIQEVTYDGLLQARREVLHRRVAEAMERVCPEDLPGYAGMLAYHYGKGGLAERAESFLFRAGADAARAAAPSEALHFFEEASKLYLELHGDGGDPAKRALLEKNIAQALYYRGRFLDAIEHFNLALRLLGDRVVEGRIELGLRFAAHLAAVLTRLYGPGLGRRRPPATARQREIMELRYARAEATVTAQPTRHLFDSMDSLAFVQRVDPASIPGSERLYAGAAAFFAFGGISFNVSRRLSAQAHALARPDSPDGYLYTRAMTFTHHVLEGDWAAEHEIEPERIAESVRNGQLWGPTTYLGLLGEKRIHRGDFASARACLEEIDEIWDAFQYDLAKTNHYYLNTLLPLEQGDLPRAIEAADAYYDENPEDLLHVLALGAKAKAQTELGELDAAEETLCQAAEIMARSGPVPPFHASAYHRSRLLLDVVRLEQAVATGARPAIRHWRRRARRSARVATRVAGKVAWRRTEVLRLAARCQAALGQQRAARRLLERSAEVGERLGARPETARTYAEAWRFAQRPGWNGVRCRGLDAAACRARARELFAEIGLRHDLACLDGR